MATRTRRGTLMLLLLVLVACGRQQAADQILLTDEWREALGDSIRNLIAATQLVYESGNCETVADVTWLPEGAPLVFFAAQDQLVRLETQEEIVAYCNRLNAVRASAREDLQEQTVHVLSPDVAFVVTRSVQTTQWQDGRTDVRPWLETAVVARQVGRWRLVYKHLSWGETEPTETAMIPDGAGLSFRSAASGLYKASETAF